MEKIHLVTLPVLAAISLASVSLTKSNALAATEQKGGAVTWNTSVDRPLVPKRGRPEDVVVKIELEGSRIEPSHARPPLNLALVLDRSGSMAGAKLEQAKQAAEMLVDQLGPDDVISLVIYETEVAIALPAQKVGSKKSKIRRLIREIQTGGSTALYGGVEAGGRELAEFFTDGRINRVILLSDGIANVGPSSNREIAKLGRRLANRGMSVTTIGLGDDYNETLMTALAEASDANYYYVADVESLPSVFEKELGELQSIVARDIEIRIRCPKGVRPIRFLGRPDEFKGQEADLRFGTLSGGQNRDLYLECRIDPAVFGKVTEIAEVTLTYAGADGELEVNGAAAPIVVGYTEDESLAEKSADAAIVAEATVWRNAMETERSIALADEGNIVESKRNLASQKAALQAAYASAPAPQQQRLKEEIETVEEAERDLESDSLSKSMRKKLSAGAYETRNSKR